MILSSGLSPAWQHVVLLDDLRVGEVNRASSAQWCASGKVLNVAVALHLLQARSASLTIVGGPTGEAIKRDMAALDARAAWVDCASPTRVCTSLVETGGRIATEVVEPTGPVSADELRAFRDRFASESEGADYVVFTGSLPPCVPPQISRDLIAATDARVILDIRGPELIEALPQQPFLVKPNRSELVATLGRRIDDQRQLLDSMRELNDRGAEWVVVTQGADAVLATSATETYRVAPPAFSVVSPIGCGDCLAAGLAWALDDGCSMHEALPRAVATAVASLATPLPGRLDPQRAGELARTIECQRL
jgi:1-phosphofructokinase family hexose kinase